MAVLTGDFEWGFLIRFVSWGFCKAVLNGYLEWGI